MQRSRHVVSAIVLLGMGAFAMWNAVENGDWNEPVVAVVSGLAVIWLAAGLGLISGTLVGIRLGRLGATMLVILGAYLAWDIVIAYSGSPDWHANALRIALPLIALLVGAGVGILIVLRPRVGPSRTASRPAPDRYA